MKLRRLLALFSLFLLAGCGPQNPQNPASSSSSVVAQPNNSILQHNGCTVDLAKVCASYINQPTFYYNGDEYDWTRFQQTFNRHPDIEIWARYPDNSVAMDIECHIDAQNRKVNWASLLPNPPMTDKSWDYVKSKRWCQEDFPDYSTWTAYWRSGITHQ